MDKTGNPTVEVSVAPGLTHPDERPSTASGDSRADTVTDAADRAADRRGRLTVIVGQIGGDYRRIWQPEFDYAAIIAVSNADWVEENEDTMRSFLAGLTEAADRAKSDEEWAVTTMKENFPVSDEVRASAVKAGMSTIPENLVVTEAVFDNTTELLVGVGSLEEADVLPYDEVFDFKYLPEAP